VSLAIGAYLLWQVALPLSYYVPPDTGDERFAWRMFSARFLYNNTCTLSTFERAATSTRQITLEPILHVGWLVALKHGRPAVVEKFLQSRCAADPSVTEVRLERRCGAGSAAGAFSSTLNCATRAVDNRREIR